LSGPLLFLKLFPLLLELQISEASADQHRGATDQLGEGLTKVVFDVGAIFRLGES